MWSHEAHKQRYDWREDLRFYRILNSDPECCEYMWSPPPLAENNKKKVLEFFFSAGPCCSPHSPWFLVWRGSKRWEREILNQNCSQGWVSAKARAHYMTKYNSSCSIRFFSFCVWRGQSMCYEVQVYDRAAEKNVYHLSIPDLCEYLEISLPFSLPTCLSSFYLTPFSPFFSPSLPPSLPLFSLFLLI